MTLGLNGPDSTFSCTVVTDYPPDQLKMQLMQVFLFQRFVLLLGEMGTGGFVAYNPLEKSSESRTLV